MRLHAYFTGISSFSLRGAPTSNEITQLLVEYFDVDEFNRQLMVPSKAARAAKIRAESISINVNSVFFALVSIFHGSSNMTFSSSLVALDLTLCLTLYCLL